MNLLFILCLLVSYNERICEHVEQSERAEQKLQHFELYWVDLNLNNLDLPLYLYG